MGYSYYDNDHTPPAQPAFINPPPFKLKKKQNLDSEVIITDPSDLEPGMESETSEVPPYNPFRYAYKLNLEDLCLNIWVQFKLDNLNYKNKADLVFKDEEGIERRVPFFPLPQPGHDPGYTEDQTFASVYRDGEKQLVVFPSIVKAESYGEKGRLQISQEAVVIAVTPERMETALIDFYTHCRQDPNCPVALLVLLKDMCKGMNTWSPEVEAAGADQNPDFHSAVIDAIFMGQPPNAAAKAQEDEDVEEDEFDDEDWEDFDEDEDF